MIDDMSFSQLSDIPPNHARTGMCYLNFCDFEIFNEKCLIILNFYALYEN